MFFSFEFGYTTLIPGRVLSLTFNEVFRLLTFNGIINMGGFRSTILLFVFCSAILVFIPLFPISCLIVGCVCLFVCQYFLSVSLLFSELEAVFLKWFLQRLQYTFSTCRVNIVPLHVICNNLSTIHFRLFPPILYAIVVILLQNCSSQIIVRTLKKLGDKHTVFYINTYIYHFWCFSFLPEDLCVVLV